MWYRFQEPRKVIRALLGYVYFSLPGVSSYQEYSSSVLSFWCHFLLFPNTHLMLKLNQIVHK